MKFLMVISLGLACYSLHAQDHAIGYWYKSQQTKKEAMLVLGTWATANIATGMIGRSFSQGQAKYFQEFNAGWNTVNFTLAAAGMVQYRNFVTPKSPDEFWLTQQKLEKTLLINAFLDVGYVGAGTVMILSANANNQIKGYGVSLITQGAFLLLFDLYYHQKFRKIRLAN